jgi:hypothetical protein
MIWVIISTVLGIAGGILAMSSLFVRKSANAAAQIAKLAQYQGYIGLTMFGWGCWELFQCVTGIGALSSAPLLWIFWLAMAIADFAVGLILGFGLISTYAFRGNATAIEKGNQIRNALVKVQVPLGALAILTSLGYSTATPRSTSCEIARWRSVASARSRRQLMEPRPRSRAAGLMFWWFICT